jgi:SAM-dependent methyltransferase
MADRDSREGSATTCYVCGSGNIGLRAHVHGFPVFRCRSCGLLWVARFDEERIKAYYDEHYFNNDSKMGYRDYLKDEENQRSNARRVLGITRRFADLAGAKILDIGSAFGFFLDEARRSFGCDVYGVEVSPYARAYAAGSLGLTHISEDGLMRDWGPGFFDAVFLIGTIEHLTSPKETLLHVSRVLKQGGALVITTINTKGLIPLYSIKPPEHLFYFDHRNLVDLLSQAGFRCVFKRTHLMRFDLHDLLHRLGKFFSLSFLGRLADVVQGSAKVSVTIPTNEMILVARKI